MLDIPFEAQLDEGLGRTCGAAALCMVYRSVGIPCTQSDVLQRVASAGPRGRRAHSYRLARDANQQGLAAVVLQARHPWAALQSCLDHGIHVIVNHRLAPESRAGHYSVLVDIDEQGLTVHDPANGPARHWQSESFLSSWRPAPAFSEITGNVLVAISPIETSPHCCALCHARMLQAGCCPRCDSGIMLQPGAAIGCVSRNCSGKLWNRVFCVQCDGVVRIEGASAQGN